MNPDPRPVLNDLWTLVRAGALRPIPPSTLLELARQISSEGVKPHVALTIHGTRDAHKPALVSARGLTTWGQLLERTRRLANHLLWRGIRPGDSVAIMLPNLPEFIETQAAAMRIGATVSFINPRAPEDEARALLERTGARMLITHRPEIGGKTVPVLPPGIHFETALARSRPSDPKVPREADSKVIVFTSGTTGRPKGAVRSLQGGASLRTLAGFLRAVPFRASDVHMVVCPLYHSSGSGFATVSQALGNPLVLVERFSPEAFLETVQREKVTTTAVVPTMLHALCEHGASGADLSSLRVVVCTGAPLRENVRERARQLLGDVIYDLYGSTEMGWVSVASPADQRAKPGSVGRPVQGVVVKIVGPDGRPVAPGEVGEIFAGNELSMSGYLDDDQLTSERMRDGLVSVRDLGYIDPDGYLYVVDRADDMLISGGVNVYPAELEVMLSEHPAVSQVAVIGVPDDKWGQRVVAAVVTNTDVSADELIGWCKQKVAYAAVPKEIRFVDELPRNDVGKIAKRQIAEEWVTT